MKNYLELLSKTLAEGNHKSDRTGTGTISTFGEQLTFDLKEGFPLVTTKKIHFESVVHELLWFLSGDTNIKYLKENGVRIWNEWADENGDLGAIYGEQWRNWNKEGVDQIKNTIDLIKKDPNSRRIIVSAWNPSVIPDTSLSFAENVKNGKSALPPCHTLFQFYVYKGKLSCILYQRSADLFLGVPFNIASYSLLTHMIAHVCNLDVDKFIINFGDAHIYNNHVEQVKEQLTRKPLKRPLLILNNKVNSLFDFTYDDITLIRYKHYKNIKAKVSV